MKVMDILNVQCFSKKIAIMKNMVLLIFLTAFHTYATGVYSQSTKLTLDFVDTPLVKVLDEIENQSEFYFLFNHKLINVNRENSI